MKFKTKLISKLHFGEHVLCSFLKLKIIAILFIGMVLIDSCKTAESNISIKNPKIKIAFMGNSITYGFGIFNRKKNSFPGIIQDSLKDRCIIGNFGVCSSTLLKKGFRSYRFTEKYKNAVNFNADIIFVKLGTNDSNPGSWRYKTDFINDYNELIDSLKNSPKHPRVILLSPVTYFKKRANKTIITRDTVCPMIKDIAKNNNLEFIDLQTPTASFPNYFWDGVHPNKKGAEHIASIILLYLKKDILKNN